MNPIDLTTKHTQKADELSLLDRVVLILEQARANVVRAVNSNMIDTKQRKRLGNAETPAKKKSEDKWRERF